MQSERRVGVTAAGGGIGLEIARAFAADGARVYICDIDEDALRAVIEFEPSITGTVCDVSDRASAERVIGRKPRTFAQWVSEHADAFRA